ncbi:MULTISPECIES: LysR family transcriptional regulator [unclassified Paraburkholderia]|uniref:LysR family transcriptional regulator n=1 Tax=unclassified Paraburkholderia TaxID=2615204 RepID=UPI002AB0EE6C|nr:MULTISPECIES: LysR family transcriptional regulator [unclassified Paraburkholderia]
MKLKHLQALQAVAESGSIQEASRKLCLTQPAVSRTIREFEGELGIPLLIRTARGATLTDYATQIIKRARAIDREVSRIYEDVEATRGIFNGRLSIGLTAPTATAALVETIAEFANARPNVQLKIIELRTQQIEEGLRDGSIDIGVLTHFSDNDVFPYGNEMLYQANMMLSISDRYKGPVELTIAELQQLPWLTFDLILDSNSFLTTLFESQGLAMPERIIRSSSAMMYMGLARRLGAIGIWNEAASPFLQKFFDDGTMRRIDVKEPMPSMSVRLAYADRDLMTAPARDFALWLRNRIEADRLIFDPQDSIFGS